MLRRHLFAAAFVCAAALTTTASAQTTEVSGVKFNNKVTVGATVCWQRAPNQTGIRFEASDERRLAVRRWIDEYLGIA